MKYCPFYFPHWTVVLNTDECLSFGFVWTALSCWEERVHEAACLCTDTDAGSHHLSLSMPPEQLSAHSPSGTNLQSTTAGYDNTRSRVSSVLKMSVTATFPTKTQTFAASHSCLRLTTIQLHCSSFLHIFKRSLVTGGIGNSILNVKNIFWVNYGWFFPCTQTLIGFWHNKVWAYMVDAFTRHKRMPSKCQHTHERFAQV